MTWLNPNGPCAPTRPETVRAYWKLPWKPSPPTGCRYRIIDGGRALIEAGNPGEALFIFLRSAVEWSASNRGLVDTLAGSDIEVNDAEQQFRDLLGELLRAAQQAGTARKDVGVADVKALMVGLQAMQSYNDDAAARLTEVVLDGLRAG